MMRLTLPTVAIVRSSSMKGVTILQNPSMSPATPMLDRVPVVVKASGKDTITTMYGMSQKRVPPLEYVR